MASTVPFFVVDVFSTTPYKGNPLAIVDDTAAGCLSDTQMKLIARQFNLSETTFLLRPSPDSAANVRFRSFLPDGKEVFGSGHNILGAWWHLAAEGKLARLDEPVRTAGDGRTEEFVFKQELGGNVTPVTILRWRGRDGGDDEFSVSLRQAPPRSHAEHPGPASLARSIGLSPEDIGIPSTTGKTPLQPQVMSTSTTRHLIVPVSSVDALNRASVDREKLLTQLHLVDDQAYGIYLFTPTEGQGKYQARFFSPGMSGEDPATGSAAGPLSGYLYRHGEMEVVDGVGRMTVVQGLMTGRKCIIEVVLSVTGAGEEVDVVGSGVKVMAGEVRVPDGSTEF